jgi:hypothetical protein
VILLLINTSVEVFFGGARYNLCIMYIGKEAEPFGRFFFQCTVSYAIHIIYCIQYNLIRYLYVKYVTYIHICRM